MKTRVLGILFRLKRLFTTGRPRPSRPADPRVDSDPWLAPLFDALGERYRLGGQTPEGLQLLRRTGKERFTPQRLYLRPDSHHLRGDYDVRVREGATLETGRSLLDSRVGAPLQQLGLSPTQESVEEWGGQVITRRYEGTVADPVQAAAAVRFICERSEQIIDTAAEP